MNRFGFMLALIALLLIAPPSSADPSIGDPLHPLFPLLDGDGAPVVESGGALSSIVTCGRCHDVEYIISHSTHTGLECSCSAIPELSCAHEDPPGDQFDCLLCHSADPANRDRLAEVNAGRFEWASTAILAGKGLVEKTAAGTWRWRRDAFDADGAAVNPRLTPQAPADINCGFCHGRMDETPLLPSLFLESVESATHTGAVFSSALISESGLNLAGKADLDRPWDVHAERLVECVDCHHAQDNPAYESKNVAYRPDHLHTDPRRPDISEYLKRPGHDFDTASARPRCEKCHDATVTHEWLPMRKTHLAALACESCHAPRMYAPALSERDWTLPDPDGEPHLHFRGVENGLPAARNIIDGFEPALLSRTIDGATRIAPHNLVTTWFWVAGSDATPVSREDLRAALLNGDGGYHPDLFGSLDGNRNGIISDAEARLDSDTKIAVAVKLLSARGLTNLEIRGEVSSESIHHSLTRGEYALSECSDCHSQEGRLNAAVALATADRPVVGELRRIGAATEGDLEVSTAQLRFIPDVDGYYVPGRDIATLADILGVGAFLIVLCGILIHSAMRLRAARSLDKKRVRTERTLIYSAWRRFWHWLQMLSITGLIFTGLVIHLPDLFSFVSFRGALLLHGLLGLVLLAVFSLAAFYHFVSGKIRDFLPDPDGLAGRFTAQSVYYLRGIFRGDTHPFHKSARERLNPLQQVTYLVVLNILLPIQMLTGLALFFEFDWPASQPAFLPMIHTLVAWLFCTFTLLHVYMTTTGVTVTADMKSMIDGYHETAIASSSKGGETA
ncbi:MAG: hypothetical protein GY835_15590 [bacterium]|nr:hypothetical protein [bacterium]